MIPYFTFPTIEIFGHVVSSFEIFVTIGLYVGYRTFLYHAQKNNLPEKSNIDFFITCIVSGFIGAHLGHALFYEQDFLHVFKFQGLSSMGGLLGGTLGALIFIHLKRASAHDFLDASIWSLLVGFFWGRMGCFSVHDHPGRLSDFLLAVQFPGGSRHDLGFYEALFLLALFLYFRKPKRKSYRASLIIIAYGAFRLGFDFLRANDLAVADIRYLGLTPGQYAAVLLIAVGTATCLYQRALGQQKVS